MDESFIDVFGEISVKHLRKMLYISTEVCKQIAIGESPKLDIDAQIQHIFGAVKLIDSWMTVYISETTRKILFFTSKYLERKESILKSKYVKNFLKFFQAKFNKNFNGQLQLEGLYRLPPDLGVDEVYKTIVYIQLTRTRILLEKKRNKGDLENELFFFDVSDKIEMDVRRYLKFAILHNSDQMKNICVNCNSYDLKKDASKTKGQQKVSWIQCDFCERWVHGKCLPEVISEESEFKCHLCNSNNVTYKFLKY